MDATTVTEVLAALAELDAKAPIRAVLAEVDETERYVYSVPARQKAAECLTVVRGFLIGTASPDDCKGQGNRMEALMATLPANEKLKTEAFCYLRASTLLATAVGYGESDERINHLRAAANTLLNCLPSISESEENDILSRLRAELRRLEKEMEDRRLGDQDRSHISPLAS